MTSNNLTARIEAVRLKKKPICITHFLAIYSKSWADSYPNYMQGAKQLAEYLAPFKLPEFTASYLSSINSILYSYESKQLSLVLAPYLVAYKEEYIDQVIIASLIRELNTNE